MPERELRQVEYETRNSLFQDNMSCKECNRPLFLSNNEDDRGMCADCTNEYDALDYPDSDATDLEGQLEELL